LVVTEPEQLMPEPWMFLNIQYTILKVNTILPNLWFCVLTIPVAGHKLWTECEDAPPTRLGGLAYDVRSGQ